MAETRDTQGKSGLSRRGFLKGVGAGTAAAGLVTTVTREDQVAEAAPTVQGPGEIPITLTVNGENKELSVEPRVTLLDAMRNRLDVTGVKRVCDRGTCGACTMLVDGKPVYGCTMLAVEADGADVKSIEALGSPDAMNAVQEAFVEHDAQQCGFCTPGFVVAATAFLEQNPSPTRDEVREGLGGNLCRCGTYDGIIDAVLDASGKMKGGA